METQNEKRGSRGSRGTTEKHEETGFFDVGKNKFLTALGIVAGGALLYKGAKALTNAGRTGINRRANLEVKSPRVIKQQKG